MEVFMAVILILAVAALILDIFGFWKRKIAVNAIASVICLIASLIAAVLIDNAAGKK